MAVGDQNYKVSLSFRDEATGKFIKATSDMTASMQKLGITTKKEATGAASDLDKMGQGMQQGGRHARTMGVEIGALAGKIGSMRNMLLVWMFALRPIIAFTKDAIKEAQNQEVAENKLASAFIRTGQGTAQTVKGLVDYATQLQMNTGFSDDQIISAQAMLATYKLTESQIRQVTPLLLDMTTAIKKGGDENANLADTAKMVGRAFDGNTTMLARSGIMLSEQSKKTKEFSSIVKDIQKSVGGAALAMAGTFQGQTMIMGQALSELKESFGNIITQSPVFASAMKMMSDSVLNFTKSVLDSNKSSKSYTTTWLFVASVLIAVGAQVKLVWRLFLEFLNIIQIVAFKIIEFFSKILLGVTAIVTAFASVIPGMKGVADQLIRFGDGVEEWGRASKVAADNSINDYNRTAVAIANTGNEILDTYSKLVEGSEKASAAHQKNMDGLPTQTKLISEDIKGNQKLWVDMTTNTAMSMRDSMADGFFKVVQGDFEGLQDVVASFGEMVVQILMKALATKAMMSIGLGSLIGMAHTGGYILGEGSFSNVRRFHSGGMSNEEIPAILKRNEGVVNESGMNSLGVDNLNRLNRGEGVGGGDTINNYYIQAIDVKSFREKLQENGDIYAGAAEGAIRDNGSLRRTSLKWG
jgi:hypothetical protein